MGGYPKLDISFDDALAYLRATARRTHRAGTMKPIALLLLLAGTLVAQTPPWPGWTPPAGHTHWGVAGVTAQVPTSPILQLWTDIWLDGQGRPYAARYVAFMGSGQTVSQVVAAPAAPGDVVQLWGAFKARWLAFTRSRGVVFRFLVNTPQIPYHVELVGDAHGWRAYVYAYGFAPGQLMAVLR